MNNNQYIDSDLGHNLVNSNNIQQLNIDEQLPCRRVDTFFYKAYEHFKLINHLLSLYCILKIIGSITLISIEITTSENYSIFLIIIWCIILIPISSIQLIYYRLMSKQTNNVVSFLKIAEKLDHCQTVRISDLPPNQIPYNIQTSVNKDVYDFNSQDNEREEKKVNILAMQIKYQSQKLTKSILWTARISFLLYQLLHFWGIYLYFSNPQNTILNKYLMVVLIVGTYQYLEIYVIIIVAIVFLPFYALVQLVKMCFNKINSHQFIRMLEPKQFKPSEIKGQHECRVCMMSYNAEDKIIVLPCNQLHHFHSICIKTWLKLSLTCPLCREAFTNVRPQQLNGFLSTIT